MPLLRVSFNFFSLGLENALFGLISYISEIFLSWLGLGSFGIEMECCRNAVVDAQG